MSNSPTHHPDQEWTTRSNRPGQQWYYDVHGHPPTSSTSSQPASTAPDSPVLSFATQPFNAFRSSHFPSWSPSQAPVFEDPSAQAPTTLAPLPPPLPAKVIPQVFLREGQVCPICVASGKVPPWGSNGQVFVAGGAPMRTIFVDGVGVRGFTQWTNAVGRWYWTGRDWRLLSGL